MKLEAVTNLPWQRAPQKKLQRLLEEFDQGAMDVAQIKFSTRDYKSAQSCYSSVYKAIERSGRNIKVALRDGEVYLYRKLPNGKDE